MTHFKLNARPMNYLFNELANVALNELSNQIQPHFGQPATNIFESGDGFEIDLAVPGFSKNEVSIRLENNHLIVSGKKEIKNETENTKWLRREFSANEFSRSFKLPETIDPNSISAKFENGILTVSLAKKPEAKPIIKDIEIG